MRIMLNSFPFERIGKIYQSTIVPSMKEVRVFYLQIPEGCVGFLDSVGVSNLEWRFIIDDEEVDEALGSINKPAIFDPPFVVHKYIALFAKNNTNVDKIAQAYANGICCEQLTLQPIIHEQKKEVEESKQIKEEVEEIKEIKKKEQAAGIVFDKKVDVTDSIKMLDNLNWTAVDILNIGPDPVYFCVNEWRQPEAPLEKNLSTNIDLGQKNAIKKMYFVCDKGGTATVYLRIMK